MGTRAARQLRGWAVAFSATGVAAAAHVLAGGSIPYPSILLLCLALSAMVSCALAGKVSSLAGTAAAVLLSQGLFHWMFTAGGAGAPASAGGPGGLSAAGSAAGHAGHAGHLTPAYLDPAAAGQLAAGAEPGALSVMGHTSAAMWLGHLLAAAVTVLLIRHGEAALLRLLSAVRLRIAAVFPLFLLFPALVPQPPKLSSRTIVTPLASLGVPLLVMRHRGPPAAAAFR